VEKSILRVYMRARRRKDKRGGKRVRLVSNTTQLSVGVPSPRPYPTHIIHIHCFLFSLPLLNYYGFDLELIPYFFGLLKLLRCYCTPLGWVESWFVGVFHPVLLLMFHLRVRNNADMRKIRERAFF
jgi:hypothetical protein